MKSMTIKIKCPVCKARNTFEQRKQECRRCNTDLALLYSIKRHSYIQRLQLLQILRDQKNPKRGVLAQAAYRLKK